MRVNETEMDCRVREALAVRPQPSLELEVALFAGAEELLQPRRERVATRAHEKTRRGLWLRQVRVRLIDLFALQPQLPAFAATLATLLLAFLAVRGGRADRPQLSFADLPPIPNYNDAPAVYDETYRAEQLAYEREVEDAHQKTSGGI